MNSLSNFFADTPQATLNNCDREQVHLTNAIQAEGAMLVLEQASDKFVAMTSNVAALMGLVTDDLTDKPLRQSCGELCAALEQLPTDQIGVHYVLNQEFDYEGRQFDAVAHSYQGNWIVEFLPTVPEDKENLRQHMRLMVRESGRVISAENMETALQITCDTARELIGFSRVKIYRFLPDWSGEVVAESRAEHMTSYLGLHFPHTDIPRQARALYQLVPYRGLASVEDDVLPIMQDRQERPEPLDLSYSLLRSASPMHTAYLRNMGVEATFSVGLIYQDKLWGLIACHNDQPALPSFDTWTLLRELGNALMSKFGQDIKRQASEKISELRRIEVELASQLRNKDSIPEAVIEFGPILQTFMSADGFAIQYQNSLYLTGRTPPESFVTELIDWATHKSTDAGQFQTTCLPNDWPEALAYQDVACGVLIQPIALHHSCQMIWFRGPMTSKIAWAGEPDDKSKAVGSAETTALLPRNSFTAWVAEHNDISHEWSPAELTAAKEILREVLDILASLMALADENKKLKVFAASAVHDIKAPLRQIEFALNIMEEDDFDLETIKDGHRIATKSSRILKNLSNGILKFIEIRNGKYNLVPVNLMSVMKDVLAVTVAEAENIGGKIHVELKNSVQGDANLIASLLLNLVDNAIKYRKPDRPLELTLKSRLLESGMVEITVADNGIGVAPEYAERIFKTAARLHSQDEIEGSGLGLSICQHIVDIHKGRIGIDLTYHDGTKFMIELPQAKQ